MKDFWFEPRRRSKKFYAQQNRQHVPKKGFEEQDRTRARLREQYPENYKKIPIYHHAYPMPVYKGYNPFPFDLLTCILEKILSIFYPN